jgi:hypothetical protein
VRRKSNVGSLVGMLLFIGIIAVTIFIYTSPMFEQEKPVVQLQENNGYWNMKKPLEIKIDDQSGITEYTVTLKSGDKSFELAKEKFVSPESGIMISVKPPKNVYRLKVDEVVISVEANDASRWNFWNGNRSEDEFLLVVDRRSPVANVITRSWGIRKGGSALVIFQAEDENMKEFYI